MLFFRLVRGAVWEARFPFSLFFQVYINDRSRRSTCLCIYRYFPFNNVRRLFTFIGARAGLNFFLDSICLRWATGGSFYLCNLFIRFYRRFMEISSICRKRVEHRVLSLIYLRIPSGVPLGIFKRTFVLTYRLLRFTFSRGSLSHTVNFFGNFIQVRFQSYGRSGTK